MPEDDTTDGDVDADAEREADGSVPEIELSLYQATVSVSGRSDDDLEDVEATARALMEYLADLSEELDDEPDGIGLG